ncbi:uncharacterized protein PRCAT00002222001 [Priceomyces carsonii]|uniref:uncharacterized protein n=1 Tax=Priceomyces carsonii TaxID=28549 RepID=UPI002EDA8CFB|nr:unnamed protein product [Priceomyces carsonii]
MNHTSISQPSSLLRKSTGKRLLMASATRTSLLGPRNLMDSLSSSAKRRSLLLTPASTGRRRQSLVPPSSQHLLQQLHQSLSQQTQSNNNPSATPIQQPTPSLTDQRPLRDKNYQSLIQQEIYDFLVANKFELEMNHSLTSKTLKQPTQKDFILIFRFLYNKIDPYYEFTKSTEVEVFSLLRTLNYPYLDGINRSQISAVGGQNWPSFLGMLYWLIKLNLSLLDINIDDESLISPEDDFDRIFIQYIRDSYNAFINERDDYTEFYNEMKLKFDELNNQLNDEMHNLQEENKNLIDELSELQRQLDTLEQSERKSRALENDLIKFKAYIETMESRKQKWSEILDKIQQEIEKCDEELQKYTNEKKDIEFKLNEQGVTVSLINELNIERDKLSKTIDLINNNLDEIKSRLSSKEIELNKNYQSLENFIKQYNNLIFKMKSKDYNFELEINKEIMMNFDEGFKPSAILNKILKDEKIELLRFRNLVNTRTHKYEDDHIKYQEQSDLINEKILEQREKLDSLESKLTANKLNYDEIYETMINDSTTYSTQIERLERELRSIKINTNQGFIELENRYQNVIIEHDEVDHDLTKERNKIIDRVYKIADFIMNFKLNIQTNLLDLDDLTIVEYENQQKEY